MNQRTMDDENTTKNIWPNIGGHGIEWRMPNKNKEGLGIRERRWKILGRCPNGDDWNREEFPGPWRGKPASRNIQLLPKHVQKGQGRRNNGSLEEDSG